MNFHTIYFRFGVFNERGNILLGGLFDIHRADPSSRNGECSNVTNPSAVQALEAMLYAVDLVNQRDDIFPGVTLSATLLDTCRVPERAKRHLLELMDGDLAIKGSNRSNKDGGRKRHVTAVVGAGSSDVSKEIAEMLAPMGVTQVSYGSSDPNLSDKEKYPTFLRTVPSDTEQAHVLVDFLLRYKWTYVKLVYSNNAYGNSLARQFVSYATANDICIATQVKLEEYMTRNKAAMKTLVSWYLLETKTEAQVVVMLTTDTHSRAVLEAVNSLVTNEIQWQQNLTWIATDHWGPRMSVVEGLERIAKNAITLDFDAHPVPSFMNYFSSLTPNDDHSKANPWFLEYWQQQFKCHLHSQYAKAYKESCDPELTLRNEFLTMSSSVPFVIDAVNSIVLGLRWLLRDHCGSHYVGICLKGRDNLHNLHTYVKKTVFHSDESRHSVEFDVSGNGKAKYKILRFTETANGVYRYGKVCNSLIFNSRDRSKTLAVSYSYVYVNL